MSNTQSIKMNKKSLRLKTWDLEDINTDNKSKKKKLTIFSIAFSLLINNTVSLDLKKSYNKTKILFQTPDVFNFIISIFSSKWLIPRIIFKTPRKNFCTIF